MWNANDPRVELEPFARIRELARGEYLFRQGEGVSAVYEVLAGRLRMVRRSIDDHLVVLQTARSGELFAESALFAETYHCDAVAAVRSRVRIYPKQEFIAALRGTPRSWEHLAELLAHELQRLRTQIEVRNIRSARERVLEHLRLNLSAPERAMHIDGELQDLGADLGLTREALYRTLARLEAEGTIARSGNGIVLKQSYSA